MLFHEVKDQDSGRSVIILSKGTGAEIWPVQPCDCKILTRSHIPYITTTGTLTVRFDLSFIDYGNGAIDDQTPEEWYNVIQHILHTYQPGMLYIHFGDSKPELQRILTVDLENQTPYIGVLSPTRNLLIFYRYEVVILILKIWFYIDN